MHIHKPKKKKAKQKQNTRMKQINNNPQKMSCTKQSAFHVKMFKWKFHKLWNTYVELNDYITDDSITLKVQAVNKFSIHTALEDKNQTINIACNTLQLSMKRICIRMYHYDNTMGLCINKAEIPYGIHQHDGAS